MAVVLWLILFKLAVHKRSAVKCLKTAGIITYCCYYHRYFCSFVWQPLVTGD